MGYLSKLARQFLLIVLAFLNIDCGYTFIQAHKIAHGTDIAVLPFLEKEPIGITLELTEQLSTKLASGGMKLEQQEKMASLILTGEIAALTMGYVLTPERIVAYTLQTTIKSELIDQNKKILWSEEIQVQEDFPGDIGDLAGALKLPENQSLALEEQRRRALRRLAVRAAEEIYQKLLLTSYLLGDET